MLIRIVRMEFEPEKVSDFLKLFEGVKGKIATFPGCKHLELCQDAKHAHVYYTFSKWEGEEYLEEYRNSSFFADTWSKTKVLFGGKPLAYSLQSGE
ncbi:MAG: antibiotic biosynthesis monooxygenase [Ekhidna sp.]|nr:antibiotic biosynthesis monooxygenase [Ekhidna sp.]